MPHALTTDKKTKSLKPQSAFSRISNYFNHKIKLFSKVCEALGAQYPVLTKIYNIATHPTTVRALSLVLAVGATLASGGTIPSLLMLSLTFIGSLLAVFGKAKQLFNTEKINQEKLIIKRIINEKPQIHQLIEKLSEADRKLLFQNTVDYRLKDKPVHSMNVATKSSILKGLKKTIRDIGIENSLPIVTYALNSSLIGAVVYFFSLMFTAKSETDARVKSSEKNRQLKLQVNNLCQHYKIKKYTNITQLFEYYLEKKVETLALEATMKECNNNFNLEKFTQHKTTIFQKLKDTELAIYLHKKTGKSEDMLIKPSYWHRLIHTLTPWKKVELTDDIRTTYQKKMPPKKQELLNNIDRSLSSLALETRPLITILRKHTIATLPMTENTETIRTDDRQTHQQSTKEQSSATYAKRIIQKRKQKRPERQA